MEAANAAHAGDGDAFSAQVGLFLLGDPADIPRESSLVIECLHVEYPDLSLSYDGDVGVCHSEEHD